MNVVMQEQEAGEGDAKLSGSCDLAHAPKARPRRAVHGLFIDRDEQGFPVAHLSKGVLKPLGEPFCHSGKVRECTESSQL